jgi:glycosyltransferase involved in cell wall biosynthesis
MPFAGDADDAAEALNALGAIEVLPGDELIVADNSAELAVSAIVGSRPVRVVSASDERSSYYARNVGADAARNEWLLFIDADCIPDPDILDRYLSEPVADHVGAIAGGVVGDSSRTSVVARYQHDRAYLDQARFLGDRRPHAVTANLLVRKRAWHSVGGFLEGIRSGGDTEFSWRLQDAGWTLGHRPEARVIHGHRESLASFARVVLRYAAGRAWLGRRYPGAGADLSEPGSALRALVAAARWLLSGQRERARFRALDALVIVLGRLGTLFPNVSAEPPARRVRGHADVVVFSDRFPERSETFIAGELRALTELGCATRVEAARRAQNQDVATAREQRVNYREDDSTTAKLNALVWLLTRHPRRCVADLLARRRWRRAEPVPPLRVLAPVARRVESGSARHLHAHFATGAALTAMRVASLTDRPYSVTAHAYEIFREPRNLREKLERAAFVTTGCRYNVEHLRRLVPTARVHEIVMGVDAGRFSRTAPYPGGRRVVAVGRLVEKKGFAYLLDAVAALERTAPIDGLELAGDGPLREGLAERAVRLDIEDKVRFLGPLDHEEVRDALERADLLAMPCVVAADGDRDSMPVVVKEALALEIPVVGSDEVGLPELIEPEWGRLVPPADADALAAAIEELLALSPEARVRMGEAGRAHVIEHCNVTREAEKLLRLIG